MQIRKKYNAQIKELEAICEKFEEKAMCRDSSANQTTPVNLLLFCPECGFQHIDKAQPDSCETCGYDRENCQCEVFTAWLNPPHKKHRCHSCNYVWKPFEFPTNGIPDITRHLRERDELYWDLLEALQDGVLREIRTYLESFEPCEREKQSLGEIHKAVSEIYHEYIAKGRRKQPLESASADDQIPLPVRNTAVSFGD
jgi:rubredoxin